LGDQLGGCQGRILKHGVEEGGVRIPAGIGVGSGPRLVAAQHRAEVEAEAVNVHLAYPVTQRVQDQASYRRAGGVDGVAASGEVVIGLEVGGGALGGGG